MNLGCGFLTVLLLVFLPAAFASPAGAEARLRVIIETDAGGDPDDEQSLVRFLLYCNEWDVEGIICNRPKARDGENHNPERTGLGIVQALVNAYGVCYPNLVKHDSRYPTLKYLRQRTVAGYQDTDRAVNLIIAAVDSPDPRPIWYCDWGTYPTSDESNLKRALDRVLKERGAEGYARFKQRLRLSSSDAFGDHTRKIAPPFPLWVDTFQPEQEGKRWYHLFSALTATAGGFDLKRDVRKQPEVRVDLLPGTRNLSWPRSHNPRCRLTPRLLPRPHRRRPPDNPPPAPAHRHRNPIPHPLSACHRNCQMKTAPA